MKQFAKLEYGRVTEIFEEESEAKLALIFGPEHYWVDVTGLDVKPGYVTKFVEGQGVIFVDPTRTDHAYTISTIEEAIEVKMEYLGAKFAEERDKIRFVTLKEEIKDNEATAIPAVVYGFDCAPEDITNFMAAFTPLMVAKSGATAYKVWLNEDRKGIVELTYEDMQKVYNEVRSSQLFAYAKYEEKRQEVLAATTTEEVLAIQWDEETPPEVDVAETD